MRQGWCILCVCVVLSSVHVKARSDLMVEGGVNRQFVTRTGHNNKHLVSPETDLASGQYLVRVSHPLLPETADALRGIASGGLCTYLPRDAFVIFLYAGGIARVRAVDGVVGVFEVPTSMKMGPGLHLAQKFAPGATCVLHVMLSFGGPEWAGQAESMAAEWRLAFEQMGVVKCELRFASNLKHKAVLVLSGGGVAMLGVLSLWLAQQSRVYWMEEYKPLRLYNKYATLALQSSNAETHEIWARGIRGGGQIVGVADTGLDVDNCFFRDDTMSRPARCYQMLVNTFSNVRWCVFLTCGWCADVLGSDLLMEFQSVST